jgi:pimeloyl-ACP methyl ester carboxylesterase
MFHASRGFRNAVLSVFIAGSGILAAGPAALPVNVAAGGTVSPLVTPVTYRVVLSQDALLPGNTYTVRGFHYGTSTPSSKVVLLLHGLSYGYWAWDFPINDAANTYSLARYLAVRGYDAVAIDELGYGSSDHPPFPDSRQLTVLAYANMAHQIVSSLHGSYAKVAIAGHSAGGEIANIEAGRYRDVNGLADIDMCDVLASAEVITDIVVTNDILGALKDYSYFGGTVAERTRLMYASGDADPAIIARDNSMAYLTPTSEMQSISPQPGKAFDVLVNAPVLVAFGTNDAIFPAMCQPFQAPLYLSSPKVTSFKLAGSGHTVMLHSNAAVFEAAFVSWLGTL